MKKLSPENLIQICEASKSDVEAAAQLLGKKFSELPARWLQDGLNQGHYQAAKVAADGADRFLVVFHVTNQKTLFVNAVAQLTPDYSNFAVMLDGLKSVAKQFGCASLEAMTLRAGMLEKLYAAGCRPIGVSVTLAL